MKKRLVAALLASSLAFVPWANAATTTRDLQLIARAVGFINGLPRGAIEVAVVDGPGADAVIAAMGRGVAAGGITLNPRRVTLAGLASSRLRVIIVPEGQRASHAAIAATARGLNSVTVSTDMTCVRAGHCVVGVVSAPRMEIVVSRAAQRASGATFSEAFRVMIREI